MSWILSIINSNLLNAYFKSQYTTISLTAAFLGELPIKIVSDFTQNQIGQIVRELMQENDELHRIKLINQIDQLVYQLYDLTEEEIAIIENS